MQIPALAHRRPVKIALGVFGVFIVLFSLRGCVGNEQPDEQEQVLPSITIEEITPGLKRTFRTTGEVEAEKSANFLADFTSTVDAIYANIGDRVTAGTQLLVLTSPEIAQQLTTANAIYTQTAQNLAQTRITAQRNVQDAQIALKTAQINYEKLLKENAARRTQAQESLISASLNLNLSEASAQAVLDSAIRKTQTTVQDALTYADELLEYSPVQEGLTYVKETHLGVRDPAQKLKTMDALNEAYQSYQSLQPSYDASHAMLKETEGALLMLRTVLINSVTSPQYTQDTLNSNISAVNADLSAVRSVVSELESAKRSLDSTMQKQGNTSQVLIDAQAQYDTTMAQLDASQQKAELEVERAQNALDAAIASARASEISAASNVTSARGELDQARISQDKLALIAPFDGVVTDIPVRVGREVQPNELVVAMEDARMLKVVTYVSAAEVRHIQSRDPVRVNDALQAFIASVAPSADPLSKKYKVEVRVQSGSLLTGEFVTLAFTGERSQTEDQRIFLPVTAVHVNAAETFVWAVDEERIARKMPVSIGELSGKYIEITSGITQGDRVVIDGGRALTTDGQEVRVSNVDS